MKEDPYNTNAKPTLGYESKGAAIEALRQQGLTYGQIGVKLGMKARAVSSLYFRHKERAKRINRRLELPANIFLDLEREAVRRGKTATELAEDLLLAIVVDKLYGAVLDHD